jgi:ABC-2 type transport system permease protein
MAQGMLGALRDVGAIKAVIAQSLAVAEKDLAIQLRFKFDFLASIFLPALINLGLFSTVYFGLLRSAVTSVSGLNIQNFISFTVLGALGATIFTQAYQSFQGRLVYEKYWQTVQILLASPLSSWAILLGVSISDAVRNLILISTFLVVSVATFPVDATVFVSVLFLYALIYVLVAGISMIRGSIYLVNENFDPILSYFMIGTAYVSCFYYPASFMPSFLQPLAYINPIYFVMDTIRALWFGYAINPLYLYVSIVAAGISTSVGTYAFRKIWRNLDITGY